MRQRSIWFVGLALVLVGSCGDDDNVCDPVAATGCDDGQVCEQVTGGAEPACFSPLVVRGEVFDLDTAAAISGARVVAIDPNGSPASSVAVSDADGNYELPVPATRNADGTPIGMDITLRADAAGYLSFPFGVRPALPVDTSAYTVLDEKNVVATPLTDIGLYPQPAGAGTATIHGKVEMPDDTLGVLVVAQTGSVGTSAIADRDGDYTIFNLPAGAFTVQGYARAAAFTAVDVTLAAAQDAEVNLALAGDMPGIVEGSLNLVNPQGATTTSVILVVESTFNDTIGRGEMPPGLRVPDPGIAPDVSGAYHFEGVPPGRYIVLAAFENDGWVRDPDLSIGGTSTLHITVSPGQTTTVDGFKVTGAIDLVSPGADGPEAITTATPTFSWEDDSSEDTYRVQVLDAFGNEVWTQDIPGFSGEQPSLQYAGPALEAGMYYQVRVTSIKDASPISRTEDLKGVFFLQP